MSSIATAYICEEEALEDLTNLFKSTKKTEPVRRKILEFMREAHQSENRLSYDILILTGLSDLLESKYTDADPITLLKESLRNLSRDTILLIQVRTLRWTPTRRGEITVDGKPMKISDIDYETTMKLQKEHIRTGGGRRKRRDNFVIARL